jgi:hypothetical protein
MRRYDMRECHLAERYQHFGGISWLHSRGTRNNCSTLKIKRAFFLEIFLPVWSYAVLHLIVTVACVAFGCNFIFLMSCVLPCSIKVLGYSQVDRLSGKMYSLSWTWRYFTTIWRCNTYRKLLAWFCFLVLLTFRELSGIFLSRITWRYLE